jgi:hypothetical protein
MPGVVQQYWPSAQDKVVEFGGQGMVVRTTMPASFTTPDPLPPLLLLLPVAGAPELDELLVPLGPPSSVAPLPPVLEPPHAAARPSPTETTKNVRAPFIEATSRHPENPNSAKGSAWVTTSYVSPQSPRGSMDDVFLHAPRAALPIDGAPYKTELAE